MRLNPTILVLAGAALADSGCSGPVYTLSDGTYLCTLTDETHSATGKYTADVTNLGKSKVKIVIKPGEASGDSKERAFHGQISRNRFYSEESFLPDRPVTMKWDGVLTAYDRMEGNSTWVEFGDSVIKITWTLVKKESESP